MGETGAAEAMEWDLRCVDLLYVRDGRTSRLSDGSLVAPVLVSDSGGVGGRGESAEIVPSTVSSGSSSSESGSIQLCSLEGTRLTETDHVEDDRDVAVVLMELSHNPVDGPPAPLDMSVPEMES